MAFLRASLGKQTTNTAGTGTLTLVANSGETLSLQQALGSGPISCRCMVRGNGYFEHFRGTFTAPSTLTRDEVIKSSNSDNPVSIPAGTTSDVYILDYAHFVQDKFSTAKTLTNKDSSNSVIFTGASTTALNMPASASCLPEFWVFYRNDGTGFLTLTPNGADTVEGVAALFLFPGDMGYIYRDGTNWKVVRISNREGTWTPTLTFGGAAVGLTYSVQNGTYGRHGNRLFFDGNIGLSAVGSSTGAAKINLLPISSGNIAGSFGRACTINGDNMVTVANLAARIENNATTIALYDFAGSVLVALTHADFGGSSGLSFSGHVTI